MSKQLVKNAPRAAQATGPDYTAIWRSIAPNLLIVVLVFAAYLPALSGQFIWDDDYYIIKNSALRSLSGLWHIWFVPGDTPQYYPLVHTTFWVDFHIWGLHPLAYHVENILLHALGAVLVWRLLVRLEIKGAWLGAALFALHPVCAESVAWITERKNTLSGVCFLLSVMAALKFWLPPQGNALPKLENTSDPSTVRFGEWKYYWCALALYLCGLWSKTAIVGLPGVIFVIVWWKRRRIVLKDWLYVLPFLALGLAMSLITISIERHYIVTSSTADEWKLSMLDRFFIAGRGFWFYLGKIFWPHPLMFFYPRWKIEAASWPEYVALGAVIVVFLGLWWKRKTWARPVLAALGYFVILLFPALGFFNIYPFRYSFVADHFQYLATIGPLALTAAVITVASRRFSIESSFTTPAISTALLLVLGVLTWRHTGVFHDLETLWTDTIARNPGAWMAHDNLGIYLSENRRFAEADEHYRRALELRPNDYLAYYDLGLESAIKGDVNQSAQYFSKVLEIFPGYPQAHYQMGNLLARQGKVDEAISEYTNALHSIPNLTMGHYNLAAALVQKGGLEEAMTEYARTIEVQPDFAPAYVKLGLLLGAKGKMDEAISKYREALEVDPNSVDALANLANGLVGKGQLEEAVTCYRQALQLDPRSPVLHFNLSVALNRQGKASESRAELEVANDLKSQSTLRTDH